MSESNVPRTPGDENNQTTTSDVTTELNVESVEAIGQEATTVAVDLPPIGTTESYQSLPGQRLELSFDATQAAATVDGANLILSFDLDADGVAESQIIFLDLAGDFDAGQSPLLIIDGTEVASEQLIDLVLAQAGDLPLETAAGAGPAAVGGGGSRYSDDFGSSIDLLNAQGVIPPTELNFGLIEPIPDIIPLPVGTPPLADNVVTTAEPHDGGEEGGEEGGNFLPPDLSDALDPLSPGDFQGDKPNNSNTKFFKQLNVDGNIGDNDNILLDASENVIGTFGGSDAETALEDLVFTLLSEPEYGTLILVSESGGTNTSSVMSVGDTFDSTDTVWWVATEDDISDFLSENELQILPDPVFGYSVTDADGNVAEETVTITLPDAVPSITKPDDSEVDEEGLSSGNEDDPYDGDLPGVITSVGPVDFDIDFGGDGLGSVTFDGTQTGLTGKTSGGDPVSFVILSGGTLLIGYTGAVPDDVDDPDVVYHASLSSSETGGSYDFTLLAPLDHEEADTEDDEPLTFAFTATDADGDTDSSTFTVTVDDDAPIVDLDPERSAILTLDESLGDGGEGDPNADDETNVAAAVGAIGYAAISGDDLFDIDASAGADGEKSTVYTLTLNDGDSGLFDTESGEEVVLSMDGDDIVGMADSEEVFRISVDEDTGAVEVNQFRALVHHDDPDHDQSDSPEVMNSELVDLTVTLTDEDNDTASDSIELGALIRFEDDGPSVDLTTDEGAELVLDESLGAGGEGDPNADDETNPDAHEDAIGYAAISGDDLFDITADAGTDGEESRVYSLTLNNDDSGLFDTESGQEVELSMDGDDIVGMADGEEVFRISVDDETGAVEVNQFRALEHGNDEDHDESGTPAIMNSGLVDLTVTLTDGDEDTASSSIELGTLIKFEDDGPEIDVKVAEGGEGGPEDLVMDHLDESIDEAEGFEDDTGNDTPDPDGVNAIGRIETSDGGEGSGDLGALFDFTKDAGTDGEDSLDHLLSFTLTGEDPDNGVETALFVTQPTDGSAYFDPTIVLFVEGDEIVGKFQISEGEYDGVALRIGIENPEDLSNATLFVEQYVAIDHDGDGNNHDSELELLLSEAGATLGVTLTSTLTDGDDDFAVDSATVVISDENSSSIVIEDDGPLANNDNVGAVPEDTAVIIDVFSNDEPGTDGVNIETGIFLADAPTKGTAEYNGDGTFTYTPDPGAEGPDSFTYTIMDGDLDGDTTTASVTLVIEGDSFPTVTSTNSSVREAALPDGTDNLSGDDVTTGSFTIDTGDDTIQRVEVKDGDGVWQNVTGGGTVDGDFGTLEVFEDGDVYTWEYTLITNTTTHTDPSEIETDDIVPEDFMVRVIDSDDDVSVADTFTIDVWDDGPLADDDGLQDTVDDNVVDENIGTVTDLLLNDNYGADGAHDTESFSVAEGDLGGTITVDGDNLLYTSATNLDPFDTTTETFIYTIKDADGDTITATFTVDLTDEGPTIGTPSDASVDEEGLSGGNANDSYGDGGDLGGEETSVIGANLDIAYGIDGAGDVTFDDAQAGLASKTSGGDPVNFVILSGGTLLIGYTGAEPDDIGDAGVVYYSTLSDAGNGTYDFTLLAPLDHDDANTEDDETLTFAFTATDAEGEGASSTFTVTVDDDAPLADDDGLQGTVDDNAEDANIGTVSGLLTNDFYGADGEHDTESFSIAVGDLGGTITIDGDDLLYTSATDLDPFDTATETFTYTIKDADGDTKTATFTVDLTDEGPTIGTPVDSAVDEEGLSGGNANDSYGDGGDLADEDTFVNSVDLDIDFGVDGAGDVTFDGAQAGLAGKTSAGDPVSFVILSGGTLLIGYTGAEPDDIGDVGVVYYATLSDAGSGSYDFTLLAPLDHDGPDTEDDETLTFAFTATDAEGETASSTFTVTVDDDAPLADDDGLQGTVDDNVVDENIGTVSGLLTNDFYGADGAHDTESFSIAEGDLGGTITIDGDDLLYTSGFNVDPFGTATETFTYTIKDADGDTITATFTVDLTDDGVIIGTPTNSFVDEEGLSGGNANDSYGDGGDLAGEDTTVNDADLDIDFGIDGAGSLTFDGTQAGLAGQSSGGDPISFVILDSGTLLIGYTGVEPDDIGDAGVVYYATLSITGSGSYDFTLLAPLDHDDANTEDNQVLTFAFTATDSEGEDPSGTFTVTVDDDAPTAANDGLQGTVDDNAEDANIGTVSGLLTNDFYGADGAHDTESFSIAVGDLGGTITIDGDDLLYTSATDLAPGDTATETFTYTIKDADGDTKTATFTVDLTDEGPTIGTPTDSSVDEEGLSGGNANDSYLDGGDLAGEDTFVSSVDLDIDFGSDGAGDVTFDGTQTGLASKTSKGDPVSFVILAGGTLLIGYTGAVPDDIGDADVVYYATLSDTGSGSYDFTLLEPLDHDGPDTEDDNTLTFAFTATDAEGEAASSTFSVLVDDDAPLQLEGTDGNSVFESELDNSQSTGTQAGNADDKNSDTNPDDTVITGDISTFASFGADGAGSSGGYTINPDTSGLPQGLMSMGDPVVYAIDGTTLWAYVENGGDGSTFDDGDRAVFSFVLLADGTWTFTLIDQIDHIAPYDTVSIELDLSSAILAMDGDGDSVILGNSVYITVVSDDVPNDIDPEDGFVGNAGGGIFTGDLDFIDNQGADEGGDVQFSETLNNTLLENAGGVQLSTLDGGDEVTLLVQDDGHTLLATTNPGDPLDETSWVFVAELDPVTDTYDITMYQALDDGSSFTFEDFSDAPAGNNSWVGIDDPRIGGANKDQDMLFTGIQPDEEGTDPDTVNTSNTGIGTNSQAISVNDGMRIDYVTSIDLDGVDVNPKELDTLDYGHHYTVNDASFSIIQTGGPATNRVDATVSVYDADNDKGIDWDIVDDSKDDITIISIYHQVLIDDVLTDVLIATWEFDTGTNQSGDTVDGITVTWDDGTLAGDVLVAGLLEGDEVFVSTEDGFNRMEVINTTAGGQANDSFDLGGFQIDSVISGTPIDLSFDLDVTDFDGDVSDGDLDFTVLPQLMGTAGDDILISNGDPEVIIGGLGDDIMTGDGDFDIFVFDNTVDEGNDQILDFSVAQGDLLSFTDVVDGGDAGTDLSVDDVIAIFTNNGGGAGIDSIELVSGTTILLTDLDDTLNTDEDVFNASLINGNL